MDSLETAIDLIRQDGCSCVLLRDGKIIHRADGRGVTPLLALYDEAPGTFRDATVVDRVIGKGASVILVHGIETACADLTPVIYNRAETGMCPIERAVLGIDELGAGLEAIRTTTLALRDGTLTAGE